MSLSSGKHIEQEINEVRCRVVESGISKSRADFLKELLEHNGYEVQVAEEAPKPVPPPKPAPSITTTTEQSESTTKTASVPVTPTGDSEPASDMESTAGIPEPTYVIGVTNIIFNAVVAVYNRALRTLDGKHVTADYWNQKTEKAEPNYWDRAKKEWL